MSIPSALAPFSGLFQDQTLVREFNDGVLPRFLWDAIQPEADLWPAHAGLTFVFTNDGYYKVTASSAPTTVDASPKKRRAEQFPLTLACYKGTDDIDATASQNMMADYAVQTVNRLSIDAAQTMDAAARGRYLSAATAGQTVADGAQVATTSLRVKRLSGFTTNLPTTGGVLLHSPVSAGNPLPILVNGVANNVIGFTADNQIPIDQALGIPDEVGPGVLLLSAAVTVGDRDPVVATNASWIQRSGAGANLTTGKVDDVKGPISYADIRAARARFASVGVRGMRRYNGYYLSMISPTAYAQLLSDPEFQRLEQGRGVEDFPYASGTIGYYNGVMFLENNNTPNSATVGWYNDGGPTPNVYGRATLYGLANASTDPIGIETIVGSDTARPIDYTTIFGDDVAKHYWQPHPFLAGAGGLTEVGLSGIVADPYRVVNDGVAIDVGYTALLLLSPRNRDADKYPATWYTKRSWTVKSDQISPTAGGRRYVRAVCIESSAVGT